MDFLDPKLEEYVVSKTANESELLYDLNRDTHLNVLQPRMLSGHLQGRVLSMLSHMIKPKTVLEIGTYTGYSALCLAEGMPKDGKLITIDVNEELETRVQSYIDKSGYKDLIDMRIGNALDIIPTIKAGLDLVFIDADKENYLAYYHLVIEQLNPGGYIIADNVLWSGHVLKERSEMDVDTKALVDYNDFVHKDDRVEHVLFPIRDGLMICRKK